MSEKYSECSFLEDYYDCGNKTIGINKCPFIGSSNYKETQNLYAYTCCKGYE